MDEMTLPYFHGTIEKFIECGIDTTTLRKSIDGTNAIVHLHGLTIGQFNEVRTKTSIVLMSYEQIQELMKTPEWSGE